MDERRYYGLDTLRGDMMLLGIARAGTPYSSCFDSSAAWRSFLFSSMCHPMCAGGRLPRRPLA